MYISTINPAISLSRKRCPTLCFQEVSSAHISMTVGVNYNDLTVLPNSGMIV